MLDMSASTSLTFYVCLLRAVEIESLYHLKVSPLLNTIRLKCLCPSNCAQKSFVAGTCPFSTKTQHLEAAGAKVGPERQLLIVHCIATFSTVQLARRDPDSTLHSQSQAVIVYNNLYNRPSLVRCDSEPRVDSLLRPHFIPAAAPNSG